VNKPPPPRLALYLLDRWGSPYHRESLAGDVIEQWHQGRSAAWCWRQVALAILAARMRSVEQMPWKHVAKTLLRVINAVMLAGVLALGAGTLTRADSSQNTCLMRTGC
jgi:hypothetical protein